MVHTISSISALSCLSDNTAGDTKIDSKGQKKRAGVVGEVNKSQSFREADFISSSLLAGFQMHLMRNSLKPFHRLPGGIKGMCASACLTLFSLHGLL